MERQGVKMEPEREDQWLDSLLSSEREDVPDSGFTNRVLSALPPRRSPKRLRFWILGSSILLACLVCLWILPAGRFWWEAFERTAVLQLSLGSVIALVSLVGMIVWGAFSAVLSES
jgi:hypothetical protein